MLVMSSTISSPGGSSPGGSSPGTPSHGGSSLIPILIAPNPILKAKARPILKVDDDTVRDLAAKMLATMYHAPGIGLAAPQVGHGLRLIVIDLVPDKKPAPVTLINPEIVAADTEQNVIELFSHRHLRYELVNRAAGSHTVFADNLPFNRTTKDQSYCYKLLYPCSRYAK